ncbi:PhzF family phenazine biosynthesis protein [Marinoscillum furvescens]|uniref:Trans-2,3-dihydro-3-hydroxyanthranilate isomerase n=1 Tax=Marinoscillum furvescens DSM 4134 TaxID=1122208 RepID=A0A3D9L6U0_MARFU|nr:PhzF family phenazine biosynthesis protein [Marinoscillum furvescens]REE01194.1 trans-2,3-dihydro-3-hydroxyanthranilate isomerase [Marinoscillum furvescens DSM 4134]
MHKSPYVLLDVFTDKKYGGNQLAIFTDARNIPESQFQLIARELNLSETVFLFPPEEAGKNYAMRIFTPGQELPTAGHPTIGTAYYLAGKAETTPNGELKISLDQKVGTVDVFVKMKDGKAETATMHQPLPKFGQRHDDKRDMLAAVLSLSVDDLADRPIQAISCGNNALIVPVRSASTLSNIRLRVDQWAALKEVIDMTMMYVFATDEVQGGDIQGRMFSPDIGITEDPATGSANGPLACYLTKYDIIPLPALSLQGYEMGRPSQLQLNTTTDDKGNITSVQVGGKSVFVGEGVHFLDSV